MMEEEPVKEDLKREVEECVDLRNYCGREENQSNRFKRCVQEEDEEDDNHDNHEIPENQDKQNHSEEKNEAELQAETDTFDDDDLNVENDESTSKHNIRKSKKKALLLKTTAYLDIDETLKAVTRKRRNDMTLKDKVRLIEMMEAKTKPAQGKIASHFNISQSQVSRIQKNRDAIIEEWCKLKNPARKRSRIGNAGNVEYKLLDWYEKVKKEEDWPAISGPILMEKARVIAQEEGIDFKPTDGWLGRWKERNGITLKRFKDKDGSISARKLGNHWKRYMFVKATKDTSPNDLWVMDEVSFVYNLLPDFLNSQQHFHPEKLIAIMAFNLTGTERRDPMLIGSSQNISSFPLPIPYQYSSEVKISKEHFAQWLRNWDRSLRTQKRKIILLMKKRDHHPDNLHLFNISIIFFPPGTESVLQPFQFGITETFISLYRTQNNKHHLTAKKIQVCDIQQMIVSVLDAVYMIARSWKHISPDSLIKGVVKTGLSKDIQSLNNSDQVAPPPGVSQQDFDKFARYNEAGTVDDSKKCQSNTDNCEERSVSQEPVDVMITPETNVLQNQESIKSKQYLPDANALSESLPNVSEALLACQVIRKYLQRKGGHIHNEFSIVESAIENDMITDCRSDLSKEMAPDQLYDPRSVHSLISQKGKIERIINSQQQIQELPNSTEIKRNNSIANQPSIVNSSPESVSARIVAENNTVNANNLQGQEMHHPHYQRHPSANAIYSTDRHEQHHHHRSEASRVEFGSELKPVTTIRYPVISQHSSKMQVDYRTDLSPHNQFWRQIRIKTNAQSYSGNTGAVHCGWWNIRATGVAREVVASHLSQHHANTVRGLNLDDISPFLVFVNKSSDTSTHPTHRDVTTFHYLFSQKAYTE
ncbi:unnamed protein product, partial [Meganyctiphanes norvegica]